MRNGFKYLPLRALPRLLLLGASALALGGCDTNKLVEVQDPNQLRPEDLDNPSAIPALIQGAIRQFTGGYSGFGDDAFLSASAVLTDEFYYGDTFTTRNAADRRTLQPAVLGNISDAAFSRLHQARLNSRRTFAQIEKFSTEETAAADSVSRSRMRTVEGYVYVTLSEGWCGSVPFSRIPDTGAIDPAEIEPGEPLGTIAMNDTAVVRFNDALALNPTNRLAQVGKGRALLNAGKWAEAAAAVAPVPTSFVYLLEHSTNAGSQNNPISALQQNGRYGVSNLEGGATAAGAATRPDAAVPLSAAATPAPGTAEGLPFRTAQDPRIPNQRKGGCFSSSISCYLNNNYWDLNADVPLASGVEARLIQAEAALRSGNPAGMIAILDTLRQNSTALIEALYPGQNQTFFVAGAMKRLDPLTDPGATAATPEEAFAARRDLLFRERAFWLYNTGHRLGDLRRLSRPTNDGGYGLPTTQTFPTGPFFRGGTYGNDVAYPVPFNEQNNELYKPANCSTRTP